MKTSFAIAALAIALAGDSGASRAAHGHPHAHRAPVAVGVAEREWGISSYRRKVRPGRVRFNVTNFGEDTHNLQVVGPGGYRSAVTPDIRAHQHYTLSVKLRRPGVYRLICTKPGHVARGMRTAIRVKR
jgi:plastocyanin